MKKVITYLLCLAMPFSGCGSSYRTINKEIESTVLVHVKLKLKDKVGFATCAGVYVDKNDILTAAHCVGADDPDLIVKEIWVGKIDGSTGRAQIERISPERDLLVLHTDLKGIPVSRAHSVQLGETVDVVGMPLGLHWVLTTGIVSRLNYLEGDNPTSHFITSAIVLPGNSGGPVFHNGKLIGIIVQSTSMFGPYGASGLGIAVSIEEIRGFLLK